jgi:hypothetical protein
MGTYILMLSGRIAFITPVYRENLLDFLANEGVQVRRRYQTRVFAASAAAVIGSVHIRLTPRSQIQLLPRRISPGQPLYICLIPLPERVG